MESSLDRTATPAVLRGLAQEGLLDEAALRRALEISGARPDVESWGRYAERKFLVLGAVLLTAGVIFFGAANWQDLGPYTRLGLVAACLVAAAGVAAYRGLDSHPGRVSALLSGMLFGPLIAIYGQIYQTGADSWAIFAAWSVVMAAFAWVSRFSGAWIAALALFHLAILLFGMQEIGNTLETESIFVHGPLALFDALLIVVVKSGVINRKRLQGNVVPVLRAALFFGLLLTTYSAAHAIFEDTFSAPALFAVLSVLGALGAIFTTYYRRVPALFPLACAAASFCFLASCLWGRLLFAGSGQISSILLFGIGVCLLVGSAGTWLMQWRRKEVENDEY